MAELSVLSPLHVGNGNVFSLIDFAIDDKKFIKINFNKVVDYCIEKNINLAKAMDDEIFKESFRIKGGDDRIFSIERFFKQYKLDYNSFYDYIIPLNIDLRRRRDTKIEPKEFIKNGNGLPYIPGSSIKGAIRTALFWKALQDKEIFDYCDELNKYGAKPKIACKKLEEKIFGKDAHEDIMRVLRISDTKQLEFRNLEINEIKIIGNSTPIPTYVENLKVGGTTSFDLAIDEKLLKEDIFKNKIIRNYLNIKDVFKVSNEFYKKVVITQLNHRFNPQITKQEFERLKKEIESCKENEMMLNLGWGGGWYTKTIGTKLESYYRFFELRKKLKIGRNPKPNFFPKTMRVTMDDKPLGWVKVRI